MKRSLLNALIFVFLVSCTDESKKTEKPEAEINFSTQNLQKSLNNCIPEAGNCTFISLNYPMAEGETKASENINEEILHFLNKTLDFQEESNSRTSEELAEEFIKNYRETAEDFKEYEVAWEASITGQVIFENVQLISISFNTDMFTGGAHGYQSIHYLNFDPATGELLKPSDLFTSEFRDFVETEFRKKQEIPQDAAINSTGLFFKDDEFQLPYNIGFNGQEILLQYNAYEIAPYSAGDFSMSYSMNEIEKYLKLNISKNKNMAKQ